MSPSRTCVVFAGNTARERKKKKIGRVRQDLGANFDLVPLSYLSFFLFFV